MRRVLAASAIIAVGVLALIEAGAHRPTAAGDIAKSFGGQHVLGILTLRKTSEWSTTAYDVVHIAGIVLIAAGGSALLLALVRLARRPVAP